MSEIQIDYPELAKQLLDGQQDIAQRAFKAFVLREKLSEQQVVELSEIIVRLLEIAEKRGIVRGIEVGKRAIQF